MDGWMERWKYINSGNPKKAYKYQPILKYFFHLAKPKRHLVQSYTSLSYRQEQLLNACP